MENFLIVVHYGLTLFYTSCNGACHGCLSANFRAHLKICKETECQLSVYVCFVCKGKGWSTRMAGQQQHGISWISVSNLASCCSLVVRSLCFRPGFKSQPGYSWIFWNTASKQFSCRFPTGKKVGWKAPMTQWHTWQCVVSVAPTTSSKWYTVTSLDIWTKLSSRAVVLQEQRRCTLRMPLVDTLLSWDVMSAIFLLCKKWMKRL